jgi:ABC-type lipoprotein release transport system permease subunit
MHLHRFILREIAFRPLNFALGALSVAAATACLVGQLALLRQHDLRTEQILAAREAETKKMMGQWEDDFRKITLKLGFNLLIIPKEATLNDLHNDEKPLVSMPEAYATRLAQSRVATINHVLPTLTQKVKWPERQRKVVLMGVRGEVFIQSAGQKPLLETVPAGSMVAGHELHQSLGLRVGEKLAFMGRTFTVSKLMEEKGNADDITLWINLREAQELLGQPERINGILALECNCAADRLAQIRTEIGGLLPDTKVVEFASQAVTRAEARNRAAQQAVATLAQEKEGRQRLRAQREAFAAVLVPVALGACALWIALLTWLNVRDRRSEIGILRALGWRAVQVLGVFIGKAALMGVLGAAAGIGVGTVAGGMPGSQVLAGVLLAAPVLAGAAAWIPALAAAWQDPSEALREG